MGDGGELERALDDVFDKGGSSLPKHFERTANIGSNSSILGQPLPQPPTYNVGHVYMLFLQSFNIVSGGGGDKATQFKTDNSAFSKLRFENTEN